VLVVALSFDEREDLYSWKIIVNPSTLVGESIVSSPRRRRSKYLKGHTEAPVLKIDPTNISRPTFKNHSQEKIIPDYIS